MNDNSTLQIDQSKINEASLSENRDLMNISSRLSYNEQRRLFEYYDFRFGKEGLQGDHDEEIFQPSLKEKIKEVAQQGLNENFKIDENCNSIDRNHQDNNVLLPPYNSESSRDITFRAINLNQLHFTADLNYKRDNFANATNTGVVKNYESDKQNPNLYEDSSKQGNVGKQSYKKVDLPSRNINKCKTIVKQTLEKNIVSEQILFLHVRNFVQKLKQRFSKRKQPTNLSLSLFKMINDKGSQQVYEKVKKSEQQEREKTSGFRKLIPVFLPFQRFCLAWDIIQIIISILFMYLYSILLFFAQNEKHSENFTIIFRVSATLFGLDILVNLNTAYFHKDQIVTSSSIIALKYLKTHLIWDVLSFIILFQKVLLDEGFSYNPNHYLITYVKNITIFFKVFGLPKKRNNILNSIILKSYQKHLLRLLNQIFFVVIAAHTVCILWNGLSIIEETLQFENTWQQKISIQNNSWAEIYAYSLYWSVTTMSTGFVIHYYALNYKFIDRILFQIVGYGDITPSNAIECLFVTASMVFMSCVFAYSINNIGMILQEIEKDSKELNDKLQIIHKFLKMKGVNIELQRRVKHYLHFLSEESKDRNKAAEDEILQMLSNKLREEVLKEINQKIINKFIPFTKNFSAKVIQELIFSIEEILVQPNQIIFKEGEIDEDQCMYFIWGGRIDICYTDLSKQKQSNSRILKTIESNSFFGEISFFTGMARSASARSVNLATLYKISRRKFLDILSHHFEDFERFKMIQEQINSQNELHIIGLECYNCKQMGHIAVNCPDTTAFFDRQLINLKNNFSLFQNRQSMLEFKDKVINASQLRKRQRIHSLQNIINNLCLLYSIFLLIKSQLIKINKQASMQLKQQAVYLGSVVLKMFEKESETDGDNYEDTQDKESNKILQELNSSNTTSSSEDATDNSSKVSIKQPKSYRKSKQEDVLKVDYGGNLSKDQKYQNHLASSKKKQSLLLNVSDSNKRNTCNSENEIHAQQSTNILKKVEQISSRISKQYCQDLKIEEQVNCFSNQKILNEISNKNRDSLREKHSSQLHSQSLQINEFCSSILNLVRFYEKQIQQTFSQKDVQQNSVASNYKIQYQLKNDTHNKTQQPSQKEIIDELNDFDRGKIFQRFFPQNNLNRVLKNIKAAQIKKNKNKMLAQAKRRNNINVGTLKPNQEIEVKKKNNNQDLIEYINKHKPTYCSYGFYTQKGAQYPIRATH